MALRPLSSSAWHLVGLTRTVAGTLRLAGGRLQFATPAGVAFDVPLRAVADVTVPFYYFGGGLTMRVDGARYRFSFVLPTQEGGRLAHVAEGRRTCRAWTAVLSPAR